MIQSYFTYKNILSSIQSFKYFIDWVQNREKERILAEGVNPPTQKGGALGMILTTSSGNTPVLEF